MNISKVTTVSFTELLLISMKSKLTVFTLCEQGPVKQLINDFNSNKDLTVYVKRSVISHAHSARQEQEKHAWGTARNLQYILLQ